MKREKRDEGVKKVKEALKGMSLEEQNKIAARAYHMIHKDFIDSGGAKKKKSGAAKIKTE
jgi:hypothetical protein